MVINVEIILGFFILFYILIIIYDIGMQIKIKKEDVINEKQKNKILELLKKEAMKKTTEEEKEIINKKLFKLLKKIRYLRVFNSLFIEDVSINKKNINSIKDNYSGLLSKLSVVYLKRGVVDRAYFAYTIEITNVFSNKIKEFLFAILLDGSIYTTENALKALYKIGDPTLTEDALLMMNKYEVNYNSKLLTDGLLFYKKEKKTLCKMIIDDFDKFSDLYKIGFINYFRLISYNAEDFLLEQLNKKISKEQKIAIIRYFSKVKDDRIIKILIDYIEKETFKDFEYEVVIVQTLGMYNTKDTIKILTKKLTDSNYYVRLNSCKALNNLCDIKEIKTTDTYAQEMINYISDRKRR